jgi:hypothetical protein
MQKYKINYGAVTLWKDRQRIWTEFTDEERPKAKGNKKGYPT